MHWRDLEGIARDIVEGADVDGFPVDLHALADAYDVRLLRAGTNAAVGNVAIYEDTGRIETTRARMAHELAHVFLKLMGYRCERVTQEIAARILLPDALTKAHMRTTCGDLAELVADAQVSWQMAAYRFTELWTGVCAIWDNARKPQRSQSRWLEREIPLTSIERADALKCRRIREHVKRGGLSGTYYVGGSPIERVVSVWELDELEEARAGWMG